MPLRELRALGHRRGRRGPPNRRRRGAGAPRPVALHEFRSQPEDRAVDGAGVRLHYLDWGSDARPDALFLHGGGLTAHTWDVVCDELRDRVRPLALDLRGHGDSEWSPDGQYPLDAFVADVGRVVVALGLRDFVLVGMSLGGLVSLAYAGRHPRDLAGLVLVDSGPEMRRSERLRDFMAADAEADSFEEFVDRAAAFNPLRDREQLRRSLQHALRRTPAGTWTWKYDRRLLERGTAEVLPRAVALWEAASAVECPALVIRGGKSDIFLDADAEKLARALRGEWVRIEGAGHTVQGDRPYDTANALRAFLDGHTIRPSPERGR
jgi:pimeloyl-ACP methyl ester carboxylesterase